MSAGSAVATNLKRRRFTWMTIATIIGDPPPRLRRALDVLAHHPFTAPGTCITAALVARDFLRAVGIAADVRPVRLVIGNIDTLVGLFDDPDDPHPPNEWLGHLVASAD